MYRAFGWNNYDMGEASRSRTKRRFWNGQSYTGRAPRRTRRTYLRTRRAYLPSALPLYLLIAPGAVLVSQVVSSLPVAMLLTGLYAAGAVHLRFSIWRRRNPVISPAEYIDDFRTKAMWN